MHLRGDKVHYRGQQGVREGIIPRAIHTGHTFIEEIVSKWHVCNVIFNLLGMEREERIRLESVHILKPPWQQLPGFNFEKLWNPSTCCKMLCKTCSIQNYMENENNKLNEMKHSLMAATIVYKVDIKCSWTWIVNSLRWEEERLEGSTNNPANYTAPRLDWNN